MPSFRAIKLKWASKLLSARYFVVLTDEQSVIALNGVNPHSFDDSMALAAQKSELKLFQEQLSELIKDHDKALQKLTKDANATAVKKSPTSHREVAKIQPQATKRPSFRDSAQKVVKKTNVHNQDNS